MIINNKTNRVFLKSEEDPFMMNFIHNEHGKMAKLVGEDGNLDFFELEIVRLTEDLDGVPGASMEILAIQFSVDGGKMQRMEGAKMVAAFKEYIPKVPGMPKDTSEGIDMVACFAPSLCELSEKYMENAKGRWSINTAGPQPQVVCFDTDEVPHFMLNFSVPFPDLRGDENLHFTFTAEGVEVIYNWDGDEHTEMYTMTHDDMLKYLDQMPVPFTYYATPAR